MDAKTTPQIDRRASGYIHAESGSNTKETATPTSTQPSTDTPTVPQSSEKSQQNQSAFTRACKINETIEKAIKAISSNKAVSFILLAPTALLAAITPLTTIPGKLLAQNAQQKLDKMDHEQITDLKKQMELFDITHQVTIDGETISLGEAKQKCALFLSTPYQIQDQSEYQPSEEEIEKFQETAQNQIAFLTAAIKKPSQQQIERFGSEKEAIATFTKQKEELAKKLAAPADALKNKNATLRKNLGLAEYHDAMHEVTIDGKKTNVMMIKAELKKLLEFSDISEESTEPEVSVQQPPLSLEEWSQKAQSFKSVLQEAEEAFFKKHSPEQFIDKTTPEEPVSKSKQNPWENKPPKMPSTRLTARNELLDAIAYLKKQEDAIVIQKAFGKVLALPLLLLGASITGIRK